MTCRLLLLSHRVGGGTRRLSCWKAAWYLRIPLEAEALRTGHSMRYKRPRGRIAGNFPSAIWAGICFNLNRQGLSGDSAACLRVTRDWLVRRPRRMRRFWRQDDQTIMVAPDETAYALPSCHVWCSSSGIEREALYCRYQFAQDQLVAILSVFRL